MSYPQLLTGYLSKYVLDTSSNFFIFNALTGFGAALVVIVEKFIKSVGRVKLVHTITK